MDILQQNINCAFITLMKSGIDYGALVLSILVALLFIAIPALLFFICWGLVEVAIQLFKRREGEGIQYYSSPLTRALDRSFSDDITIWR